MTYQYSLTLDIFSGTPNPLLEIHKEDFTKLYLEVLRLQDTSPASLFDGLGFRGFILMGLDKKVIAQKKLIKINVTGNVFYKQAKPDIITQFVDLFRKYNNDKSLQSLIDEIAG